MGPAQIGAAVHAYAPHSASALYMAALGSAVIAMLLVYGHCLWTGSTGYIAEGWLFRVAASAAPIPTYTLLLFVPFDPDLAQRVLDDRVVVALAGFYGLVETLKDIREAAADARRRKVGVG